MFFFAEFSNTLFFKVKVFSSAVILLALSVLLCLLFMPLSAQPYPVSEHEKDKLKVSYIFNFIRFIQWPKEKAPKKNEPVVICNIEQSNRFVNSFQSVSGKVIKGHPLVIRKISLKDSLESCHLLYISPSERTKLSMLLRQASLYKVLPVSDIAAFCKKGGVIGLVVSRMR